MFNADPVQRMELVLYAADRQPWILNVSPGIERFIGHYPRVEGIDAGGPLLEYRVAYPAD